MIMDMKKLGMEAILRSPVDKQKQMMLQIFPAFYYAAHYAAQVNGKDWYLPGVW